MKGAVGFAIGGFDFGDRRTGLRWAVVEEAVGERAADSLMEKHEEQGGAGAVVSQAISMASAVAFQQPVSLHFAQVITELRERVAFRGETEACQDCFVDLGGAPSRHSGAGVQ